MGKVATPVTLKTFLPAETDIGGMTIGQYLARSRPKRPPSSTPKITGEQSMTCHCGAT
jgi:hypothetical protein